jgi:hypothetical protein
MYPGGMCDHFLSIDMDEAKVAKIYSKNMASGPDILFA